MRLHRIQECLSEKGIDFTYTEQDGLGSVDFIHRGLYYHVWEFADGENGAESNVANTGKTVDYFGDYETQILEIIKEWQV